MTAGRPAIPLAEKVRRLTGEAEKRLPPLPFDWPNPFDKEQFFESHWAWDFVVKDCQHRGVLSHGDRNLIYEYCVMFRRAILAGDEWEGRLTVADDMGVIRAHPALRIEESSWERCRKIGGMLGLDPINRNKPAMVPTAELGIAEGTNPARIDLLAFARDRSLPPPWERDKPADSGDNAS